MYLMTKHVHITFALISIAFFVVRGIWMLKESDLLQKKWVKILPPIVDTILLLSAIKLCFLIQQAPFVDQWLTFKVLAVVLYIVLGVFALNRGKTKQVRIICFGLALLTVAYILGAAHKHSALSWLA